ncbi:hypothetical protein G6F63_014127 [Rhizopus arrhizus]|nr:hypothetical protein G6F63_014127 [Rhizopus arrhizus]
MADNYSLNPTAGFKAYRDAYHGPGPVAPGRAERLAAAGVVDLRHQGGIRTSQPVQPRARRGLYGPRPGCADRQSRGLEQDRPAADVRRERRLLRPHAATGTAFARGRRLGRRLIGQYRRRVSPSSGTG